MSRRLLAGSLVLGALVVGLVLALRRPSLIHSYSVSHFLAAPQRDTFVRVIGQLVKGSLCYDEPCQYRFTLKDSDGAERQLRVHYAQCFIPDSLIDLPAIDVRVTVEGELCAQCHTFEAARLFAGYPHKYELNVDGGPLTLRSGSPTPRCAR